MNRKRTISRGFARRTICILTGVSASVALTSMAKVQATVINWQSIGQEGQNGQSSVVLYSGQGAVSDPGHNYWNAVAGTGDPATVSATYTNLVNNTNNTNNTADTAAFSNNSATTFTSAGTGGPSTSILLTLHNPRGGADYSTGSVTTALSALMGAGSDTGDGAGNGNGPGTFTISGLTANQAYSIYLYNGFSSGQLPAIFTINTTNGATVSSANPQTLTGDPNASAALALGTNYALFNGTADNSGNISGSFSGNAAGNGFGLLSGIQLNLFPTPEPACIGLIGFGALGLLARRRRRA